MSIRAKRPLNKAAVKNANDEFYANHPELNGQLLSATDPKQATLRQEWMDSYVKHGGKVEALKGKTATGETIKNCPRPADSVNGLFSQKNLKSIPGQEIQGQDSMLLQDAMQTLWENRCNSVQDEAVQEALQIVAKERGVSLDKIQTDWKRYQDLLNEQQKIGKDNDQGNVPGINWLHPNFMASTSQLRSGKVVGDALGIDPVFGALLNPTGGLVGPGNFAFDGNDSAIGYHGAVHDAAGYLKNYHNFGPGYDYLGTDNRDTTSPLSGQRNGINYWRNLLKNDTTPVQKVTDLIGEGIMRVIVGVADIPSSVKETVSSVKEAVSNMYSSAKEAASDVWDKLFD